MTKDSWTVDRTHSPIRTWLRVPGMLCTQGIFTVLDPYLQLPGRVVDAPITGVTLDGAADHLLSLAHQQSGPVGVFGVSLGAIVAMAAAAKDPAAFDAVVLMSTNAQAPRPEQLHTWTVLARRTATGHLPEIARELAPALFAPQRTTDDLLSAGRGMAQELGPRVLLDQLRVQCSRRDLRPDLLRITARTLVVAGSADQLCSLQAHQDIADGIPDAELHILAGHGHLMTLEDPETVADLINRWAAGSAP